VEALPHLLERGWTLLRSWLSCWLRYKSVMVAMRRLLYRRLLSRDLCIQAKARCFVEACLYNRRFGGHRLHLESTSKV